MEEKENTLQVNVKFRGVNLEHLNALIAATGLNQASIVRLSVKLAHDQLVVSSTCSVPDGFVGDKLMKAWLAMACERELLEGK